MLVLYEINNTCTILEIFKRRSKVSKEHLQNIANKLANFVSKPNKRRVEDNCGQMVNKRLKDVSVFYEE